MTTTDPHLVRRTAGTRPTAGGANDPMGRPAATICAFGGGYNVSDESWTEPSNRPNRARSAIVATRAAGTNSPSGSGSPPPLPPRARIHARALLLAAAISIAFWTIIGLLIAGVI